MTAKEVEYIKNRIAESSQLMVTAKFPHIYYRAVGTRKLDQILDEAFEDEEEQSIPGEKPIILEYRRCLNDEVTINTWMCPTCNTQYESEIGTCGYCPYCGQKIDWSDRNVE